MKYASASPGTKLVLTGRRKELLDQVVAEVAALGNGSAAHPLCVDVVGGVWVMIAGVWVGVVVWCA